jgi:hypothetical protein
VMDEVGGEGVVERTLINRFSGKLTPSMKTCRCQCTVKRN